MCQSLLFSNLSLFPGDTPPTPHPTAASCWFCSVVEKIWINLSASLLQQQQLHPTSHRAAGRRPVRHIPSSLGPVEQRFCYDEETKGGLLGCLCDTTDRRLMGRCCSRRNILIGIPWLYFPSCSGHLSGTVGFCWRCTEQNLLFSVLEKKVSERFIAVTASCFESRTAAARSLHEIFNCKFRQFKLTRWNLNSSAASKQEAWPAEMNKFDAFSLAASLLRDTVISHLLGYERTALEKLPWGTQSVGHKPADEPSSAQEASQCQTSAHIQLGGGWGEDELIKTRKSFLINGFDTTWS